MKRYGNIVCYTDEELAAMQARGETKSDWAKVDAMTEEELEASIAADPDDVHEPLDWSKAFKGLPPVDPTALDTRVEIDRDIFDRFRAAGDDYEKRINDILRGSVRSETPSA